MEDHFNPNLPENSKPRNIWQSVPSHVKILSCCLPAAAWWAGGQEEWGLLGPSRFLLCSFLSRSTQQMLHTSTPYELSGSFPAHHPLTWCFRRNLLNCHHGRARHQRKESHSSCCHQAGAPPSPVLARWAPCSHSATHAFKSHNLSEVGQWQGEWLQPALSQHSLA